MSITSIRNFRISGSILKLLAVFTMLVDHMAWFLFKNDEAFLHGTWFMPAHGIIPDKMCSSPCSWDIWGFVAWSIGKRMRLKRQLDYCSCWPFLSSSVQIMAIGDMDSF